MLQINKYIWLFIICLVFFSCKKSSNPDNKTITEKKTIVYDITQKASYFADSVLSSLTLEERIGQCFMPSIRALDEPSNLSLLKKYIEDYHVGGIVLLQGNVTAAKKLSEIGSEAKVPLFIAIDAEWGLGMRLEDAPVYPKNGKIDKSTDETYLFDYGQQVAKECREVGINMVLGPVVDITTSNSGIIGKRSFGDNPQIVSDFSIAYSKGLESGGIISVAKHFPGHGSTIVDSHRNLVKVKRSITELDSIDLKPFRDYVNSGLSGIMAGHIQSLALDPSGRSAAVSMDMLTSLLREEMGFKGLILTDAFDMGGAKGFSASDAIRAGADIILCPLDMAKEYKNLISEVKTGALDLSLINDRCKKILFYKFLFSLN